MEQTVSSALIAFAIIASVIAAGFFAYNQGYLDPLIEKIGVMLFKAKAKAEQKKLQAQGMKMGEDFVGSPLQGNKQAEQVKLGVGPIGSLKKEL